MGCPMTLPADAPRFATRSTAHQKNSKSRHKSLVDHIRRVDLEPVLLREGHIGQHIFLAGIHQLGDGGVAFPQAVGDAAPLLAGGFLSLLHKDRFHQRCDGGAVRLADPAEEVAHPVHPASLLAGVQHFRGGCTQAFVIIGNDELHTAQAACCQGPQEVLPEGLCFGFSGGKAEDLALAFGVGPDSHYRSRRDDPAALPAFDVGRVDPQVRPLAFDRAVQESLHQLIDLFAQPADLALRDAGATHRLDQVIDSPCRDALDVGFLDDGRERLLSGPSRLEERREVGSLAQLRDVEFDPSGTGFPGPFAVPVPVSLAIRGADTGSRARARLHFQFHDPPGRKGQHVAHQIVVGALVNQLEQSQSVFGHRVRSFWLECRNHNLDGFAHDDLPQVEFTPRPGTLPAIPEANQKTWP